MISKTVEYKDFNGETQTDELHFNISKTEIAENLDLEDEFRQLASMLGGKERKLETKEVQQVFNMFSRILKMGYGVKSADGRRFEKSEKAWLDFRYSNAYDVLLFSLFEQKAEGMLFIQAMFPNDLIEEAKAGMEKGPKRPMDYQKKEAKTTAPRPLQAISESTDEGEPHELTNEQMKAADAAGIPHSEFAQIIERNQRFHPENEQD